MVVVKMAHYLTYIRTRILLTHFFFFSFPTMQKLQIYHVWFLFGGTPVLVLILFREILEQSINNKMASKI